MLLQRYVRGGINSAEGFSRVSRKSKEYTIRKVCARNYVRYTQNEVTAAAIEEGRRIASDSNVKGYSSMDALRAALDE